MGCKRRFLSILQADVMGECTLNRSKIDIIVDLYGEYVFTKQKIREEDLVFVISEGSFLVL